MRVHGKIGRQRQHSHRRNRRERDHDGADAAQDVERFSRSFDRHRPATYVAAAHGHKKRADPRGGVIAQIRERQAHHAGTSPSSNAARI